MALEVQIQSFLFSFVYGMFFSMMLNLNYKYIFDMKLPIRIVTNIFFIVDLSLLYFILLRLINHGILHLYFFLCLALGFVLGQSKTRSLRKIFKKKSSISGK